MRTAEDYTLRSKAFLELSRQIQQVATDYNILTSAVEHLRSTHKWYEEDIKTGVLKIDEEQLADEEESRIGLRDTLDQYLKEVELIRTYSTLYLERTKIGVQECFAMINQRDAEVSLPLLH